MTLKMKKAICLFLIGAITMNLFSCGQKPSVNPTSEMETSEDDYTYVPSWENVSPEEIKEITLPPNIEDENLLNISDVFIDSKENFYLWNNDQIRIYDKEGTFLFSLDSKNENIMAIAELNDTVFIAQWIGTATDLSSISLARKSYDTTYAQAPEGVLFDGMISDGTENLLFCTKNGLIKYNPDSGKSTLLISWIDCGIDPNCITDFNVTENGYEILLYEWETSDYQLCTLTKTLKSEIPTRQVLTLGTISLSQSLEAAVSNFNANNSQYQIEVINYGQNSDPQTRFYLDLMTGKAPDLIDLSQESFTLYMKKGILEDLNPYLEKSGISRDNFLPSVIDAYTIDGKIGGIPASVLLRTMIGKNEDFGKTAGYTVEDLIEIMDKKTDDTMLAPYATKDSVLYMCVNGDEKYYIDWETGVCHFDSDKFKKVLEFANRFPVDYSFYENYHNSLAGELNLFREGKYLLIDFFIPDFNTLKNYQTDGEDDFIFVGNPSFDAQSGTWLRGIDMVGINSSSSQKDGAWEFIKTLLTEEYQTGKYTYGFPTLKSAFNLRAAESMAEGEYSVTEEEVKELEELITSTTVADPYSAGQVVYDIILEEAGAYFSGQKPLEEVAKIIQNRVQLYVDENM